jgi:hypothetical protein
VNPIDMKKLIENAKAAAAATGASAPHEGISDSLADGVEHDAGDSQLKELADAIDSAIMADEGREQLAKKAAEARVDNIAVAKVLLAVDILSEVRR